MAIWWQSCLAALAFTAIYSLPQALTAATTGQLYWCDVRTGYAIGGYDPVAYFVDGTPRLGANGFEYDWKGGTWRFVSAANRAVFARDPEVYAPQFGGYGAETVASGVLAEGSPRIWLIFEDRLFFFRSARQRGIWQKQSVARRYKAIGNWPKLNRVLVRQ